MWVLKLGNNTVRCHRQLIMRSFINGEKKFSIVVLVFFPMGLPNTGTKLKHLIQNQLCECRGHTSSQIVSWCDNYPWGTSFNALTTEMLLANGMKVFWIALQSFAFLLLHQFWHSISTYNSFETLNIIKVW